MAAEFAVDALTAVPEVSTWAMMLIVFAGLGLHAFHRSRKRAITARRRHSVGAAKVAEEAKPITVIGSRFLSPASDRKP